MGVLEQRRPVQQLQPAVRAVSRDGLAKSAKVVAAFRATSDSASRRAGKPTSRGSGRLPATRQRSPDEKSVPAADQYRPTLHPRYSRIPCDTRAGKAGLQTSCRYRPGARSTPAEEGAPAKCGRPDSESANATAACQCRVAETGRDLPHVNDNKARRLFSRDSACCGPTPSSTTPSLWSTTSTLPKRTSELLDLPREGPSSPAGRRPRRQKMRSV